MDMEKKGVIAASEPKWISVKERLPEPGVWVLVFNQNDGHLMDYIEVDGDWWCNSGEPVTHWMELPKPPKQEV